MYAEPGGYYELGLQSQKPIVACVVGRWKAKLTRAVGHAGAMAGAGDDAATKERWFMEMFGVDGVFTPNDPVCSAKGAVVTNIAHIPQALTRVMALNGMSPDFAPKGDLSLKAWFGNNQGLTLPPELDLPVVEAQAPYDGQIKELRRHVGAVFIRQSMKDASGATVMDPATQVTSLHGVSMLEAAREPFEANLCLAVLRERNGPNDNALANIAIAAHVNLHGDPLLAAAEAARAAGNAPNAVLATAACILGPGRVEGIRRATETLLELFLGEIHDAIDEAVDLGHIPAEPSLLGPGPDRRAAALLAAVEARRARSVFVRYLRGLGPDVTADAVLAALALTMAWGPLQRKRISRRTALNLPWYLALYGTLIGACGAGRSAYGRRLLRRPQRRAAAGIDRHRARRPGADRPAARPGRAVLLPGAPGPAVVERTRDDLRPGCQGCGFGRRAGEPERVQLNKAMAGFLTHSGFSHGGNGFEGIQFLLEQFEGQGLEDPARAGHAADLAAMATRSRRPTSRRSCSAASWRPTGRGPSPASTIRSSAASTSTPTRARPSSPS